MPVTPTYPGVYIEEVSSGVRTITGVPPATEVPDSAPLGATVGSPAGQTGLLSLIHI